jgi:hypothetical protein
VFGVRDTAAQHPQADGHPAIIGYALDGFAVHASYSRAEGETLDACNGHTDSARGYHYHATRSNPYLLGCNRGVPAATIERTMNLCGATGMMTMTDGGTTEPRTCGGASECAGACGPSATDCTCATTPTGMRCIPTCRTDADCPTPPMGGALRCDTARGLCVPR